MLPTQEQAVRPGRRFVERVPGRVDQRDVQGVEVVEGVFHFGAYATAEPEAAEESINSLAVWVRGCRWPSFGRGEPGRWTSTPPAIAARPVDAGLGSPSKAASSARLDGVEPLAVVAASDRARRERKRAFDRSWSGRSFPCFWPRNSIRASSSRSRRVSRSEGGEPRRFRAARSLAAASGWEARASMRGRILAGIGTRAARGPPSGELRRSQRWACGARHHPTKTFGRRRCQTVARAFFFFGCRFSSSSSNRSSSARTRSAIPSKVSGSWMAISERLLRSRPQLMSFRPWMNRL